MVNDNYGTDNKLMRDNQQCDITPGLSAQPISGQHFENERRLRRVANKDNSQKPLITVVTVVFNGEDFLEKTIKSVISQSYDNIEYIIIDGGSTDATLNIIKEYEHAIDYWVSASDKGIYDAMNKGIELATGDWICFMNGGDEFYQQSVIAEVFALPENSDVQVVVGRHQVVYSSGRTRLALPGAVKDLWRGSQFCHQATFVKTDYHRANKFNLQTKIVADFEFFYHAWQTRAKFRYTDVVVAKFEAGGISDVKRIDAILGFWTVVEKSPSINLYYAFRVILETFKSFLK